VDEREMENKKERILDIHIATVDIKSKKILSIKVTTDEHIHDSKVLPEMVEAIIKSDSITAIGKLFADYNNIFRYLGDNGIHLFIY
jgi:hypothetical protein